MENIIINIDSDFRDKKTYTNSGFFVYKLAEKIKNITYLRLSSIELPSLFYTFTNKNNNISFAIKYGIHTYDVIIKEGNYDSALIISEIQCKLTKINKAHNTSFKISWDMINYKITITNTNQFSLIFKNDDTHRSLGNRLGYTFDDSSYLSLNQSTQEDPSGDTDLYYWTAETVLDITKDDYLYLRVNDYGVIYNDVRSNALLAKIILYDAQFVIDTGANFLTKSYVFKQPTSINKLEIELVDKRGVTVDMNLINFSLTLELGQIYDITKYTDHDFQVIKQYDNITN
jgi:hypothetical protein